MPLDAKEHSLLVKCMGMTMSDQDGEALAALRKAKAILERNKVTWSDLLSQPAGFIIRPPRPAGYSDPFSGFGADWDGMAKASEARRAQREAQSRRATDEAKVRVLAIDATFELLLKSERLPPLKRDHFQSMKDIWDRSHVLTVAQEAALKRAYAVYA